MGKALGLGFLSLIYLILSGYKVSKSTRHYLLNETKLLQDYTLFKKGNKETILRVNSLVSRANDIVNSKKLYSVTYNKTKIAPSEDIHDFYSQSPYWWVTNDGKVVKRDGIRNSEVNKYRDKAQLITLVDDLQTLSLSYYFTKEDKFSKKAYQLMDTWFLNKSTKMNPNGNFTQVVPKEKIGSFSGILDTRQLTNIPDILLLFEGSKEFSDDFNIKIRKWFTSYLNWLQSSKLGIRASVQKNNIGTYYDLQVCVYTSFIGKRTEARDYISTNVTNRLKWQIDADGKQPLELSRSKGFDYSVFNLRALCQLAILSDNIQGPNLWLPNGASGVLKIFNWFNLYIENPKEYLIKQSISTINYDSLDILFDIAIDKNKKISKPVSMLDRGKQKVIKMESYYFFN